MQLAGPKADSAEHAQEMIFTQSTLAQLTLDHSVALFLLPKSQLLFRPKVELHAPAVQSRKRSFETLSSALAQISHRPSDSLRRNVENARAITEPISHFCLPDQRRNWIS